MLSFNPLTGELKHVVHKCCLPDLELILFLVHINCFLDVIPQRTWSPDLTFYIHVSGFKIYTLKKNIISLDKKNKYKKASFTNKMIT